MRALLLLAALAAPAPEHPHCVLSLAGGQFQGSCGSLLGGTPSLTLRAAKGISTGAWRRDARPASVWTVEAKNSEDLTGPMELEVYSGGSGVLRTPVGWFAVSGFVQARDTLSFDLDAAQEIPPNELDRAIVEHAASLLSSDAAWNRADDRNCKADAKTWSIYCALERATVQLTGGFHHRRPALEVVRAVVDERTADRNYAHRLMDYNNDPSTRLADVQSLFTEALTRIAKVAPPASVRLELQSITPAAGSPLNEFSTIVAVLDYAVEKFEPGKYVVDVAVATDDPAVLKIATDSTLPRLWALRKSAGTVKVNQPLRTLWKDPHVTHPIKVYFELSERGDAGTTRLLMTLGPVAFAE